MPPHGPSFQLSICVVTDGVSSLIAGRPSQIELHEAEGDRASDESEHDGSGAPWPGLEVSPRDGCGTNGLTKRWSNVYHQPNEGRLSSIEGQTQPRANLLQGTLDMLILRTLLHGSAHGHQIGKHIQRTTNDFLQMQHGSLYPGLHRLERRDRESA